MTASCTLCGAPLTPRARFCANCGTPVSPSATGPAAAAPTAAASPGSPYERPATGGPVAPDPVASRPVAAEPVTPVTEWHAEDEGGPGGYEEYYPEDFPDHLPTDAGRQVMAGASYPTAPPPAYGPPAYGPPAYGPPAYGPPGDETYDEPAYDAGGFTGRGVGLAPPWQEPDGSRSRVLLIGGAGLVGVLVLIGLVYFLLFRPSSSPTAALPSSTPATSAPAASSPPVAGSTAPVVTTPPSPSQPAYPAVALPAGSTLCPTVTTGAYAHAAAGNASTSCEFATAVRAAYVPLAAPGTSVSVRATSPRTGKTYTMTCSGMQPVTCGGGNNALVFLFGGTPTTP